MAELLTEPEIETALADLPDWRRVRDGDTDAIRRAVKAPSFPEAISLVDGVAVEAESRGHHPDIDIRWRTVTFTCSTHSDGGLTALDVGLAHAIDDLAGT